MEPTTTPDTPELRTETGELYDIPEGGSLGLLALGYAGVMLWRQKIAALRNEQQSATETPQS